MLPSWALVALLTTIGTDAYSTHRFLARGQHEAVLSRGEPAIMAELAGEAALGAWANHRLRAHHPTLAAVLACAGAGAHGAATVYNLR